MGIPGMGIPSSNIISMAYSDSQTSSQMAYRRAHSFCCTGGASAGLDQVVVSVVGAVTSPGEGDLSDQLQCHMMCQLFVVCACAA